MENRFGLKDFILFTLLGLLIVAVFLTMKQYDRQWKKLEVIDDNISQQTELLSQLNRTLQRGISVNATASTTPSGPDPFVHIKAAQAKPDYARGDWLIDNFGVKVARLTPFGAAGDLYGAIFRARVQEQLAYRDPYTLEFIPLLARSWQVSPDGLTITVQLRQGVTFSDGQPLSADDVIFSFNLLMNPKIDAPRERAYYEKVASVEKSRDDEVVFHYKEPYFDSLALTVSMTILPKHFYEKFSPEEFNTTPGLLMGSGPYQLKDPTSWKPGSPLELVRNLRYWGEPGPFDRLVYRETEQESVEMTMFRNGEVDIFRAQPEQYKLLLKDKSVQDSARHFEYESPISGYSYIAWNEKRNGAPTLYADKRVRQAMTMLIDRQAICDQVFLGYAKVASGPFSPLSKQYDASVKPWPYNVDRGRELLKEAGFTIDPHGTMLDPKGMPFHFKLTYGSRNETSERVALFMKDMLARAGIALEPDPADWPIMLKKINDRDFDAITLGWSGGVESDIYQEFHSSQIQDQGDNFESYSNPHLDELIVKARGTVDEAARMPLWRECHRILHEDQPYTFLYTRMSLTFFDKRIQNIEKSKLGLNYISDDCMPLVWYVPKALQKWK